MYKHTNDIHLMLQNAPSAPQDIVIQSQCAYARLDKYLALDHCSAEGLKSLDP